MQNLQKQLISCAIMVRSSEISCPETELRTPPCPHFEECGSCQFQHIAPSVYRSWKEDGLKQLIAENGLKPDEWLPSVFINEGTRRRVSIKVTRDDDGNVALAFHKFHSHDLTPITDCLLLTPKLSAVLQKLPEAINALLHKEALLEVSIQQTDNDLLDCVITGLEELGARQTGNVARFAEICGISRVSFRKDAMSRPVTQVSLITPSKSSGAIKVDLPSGAFLQPSLEGEAALCQAVLGALADKKLGKKDKVIDLFSGCGTFAGQILERTCVHAVEGDKGMADALVEAAKGHGRLSAEWRDLYKEPVSSRELRAYNAVIFDPPRAGAKEQCQMLAKTQIPVIVGVSCNPATFARDAKILIAGGYRLKTLQMVDQFTWSSHLEMVGVFEK